MHVLLLQTHIKKGNMAHLHTVIKFHFMLGLKPGDILMLLSTVDDSVEYVHTDKNFKKHWGCTEGGIYGSPYGGPIPWNSVIVSWNSKIMIPSPMVFIFSEVAAGLSCALSRYYSMYRRGSCGGSRKSAVPPRVSSCREEVN